MDTTTILLAAICIVIGFLVGGLFGGLGKKPDGGKEKGMRKSLLKVWRDPQKSNLVVEIDGRDFNHSVQLNARQRSEFGQLILALNDWLEAKPAATRQPAEWARGFQDQRQELPAADKQARMSMNPVDVLSNALKADVPKSQLPTESIVSQIDAILQEKLRDSELHDEGVRLMEMPGKGMVVMVGLEKYEQVEDVPNNTIQEMIRLAVREWEEGNI
jgi:hypothetical protein